MFYCLIKKVFEKTFVYIFLSSSITNLYTPIIVHCGMEINLVIVFLFLHYLLTSLQE